MTSNITEQEKQELLKVGQWGNKMGQEAWNKQCDNMKKARNGSYPDDWYQLIILGQLYTKPVEGKLTFHEVDFGIVKNWEDTTNHAHKYMRSAGSSAWLDDSAAHREARKQRESSGGPPMVSRQPTHGPTSNEIPNLSENDQIRPQLNVADIANAYHRGASWEGF